MKKFFLACFFFCALITHSKAGVGISAGLGVPFVSQYGLNINLSNKLSLLIGQNTLDVSVGTASVELTMPEFSIHWHPFAGSFYLGVGMGKETLNVTAVDLLTSNTASAEVSATTTVVKLGWMWGKENGGFWFGMDVAYIMPSGGEVNIVAPGLSSTDQAYIDVADAGEKFGETAYANITFARLGYLF